MTDQELIKALRWCGDCLHDCMGCPGEENCNAFDRGGKTVVDAADRMEALLRDNAALDREVQIQICKRSELEREIGRLEVQVEHLKAGKDTNVPTKWVSVSERLPETEGDVLVTVNGKIGNREYVGGYLLAEYVPGEGWILEEYPQWENPDVTYWCNLPEPPSTEGVE